MHCSSWRRARVHLLQWPAEGMADRGEKSVLRYPWESLQAPSKTGKNENAGSGSRGEHLPVEQQEKGHLPPGPQVPRALGPLSPHRAGMRSLPELPPQSPFWPFSPVNPGAPGIPGGPIFPGGPCKPLGPCPAGRWRKCDPVAVAHSLPSKALY